MLLADKRALETNLKVSLLSIREKELNFYTNNCLAIGTQSALLAGFAYAALQTSIEKEPLVLHLLYLICSVASLGFQLLSVVSTTLLAMLGPGLALRGPDGSMHSAVDNMVGEYRYAFFAFLKGLLALHGAAIAYSFIMLQTWFEKIVISTCICISLYMILSYIRVLLKRFAIPMSGAVTGRFDRPEDEATGVASGINDSNEIRTLSSLIHAQEAARAAQRSKASSRELSRAT